MHGYCIEKAECFPAHHNLKLQLLFSVKEQIFCVKEHDTNAFTQTLKECKVLNELYRMQP